MPYRVTIEAPDYGGFILRGEDGRSYYARTDWDYPQAARILGHDVTCCGRTDGTVDCEEHGRTVDEMLSKAGDWLWEHRGEELEVEDPEYATAEYHYFTE